MELSLLPVLIMSCAIAMGATPFVKKLAIKIGATDAPNARKVHKQVMPRLGGLAIYLAFTLTVLFTQPLTTQVLGLLLGGLIIMLVGLLDDTYGLSPKVKLLGQIVAALVAVQFGYRVEFITNPFNGGIIDLVDLKLSTPVTLFWIIGITNAINLIDGLDGLAAGTSAIAAVTMAVVAWSEGLPEIAVLALILAAAVLGFLKYNFNPAQIFMGDSGSLFLGFNLGALAIEGLTKGATVISLFIPIVILGIPIMDTMFAIIRRFSNGQPIFQPDKKHLHHCLLELGLSHKQTVLAIYGINVFLGASAVLLNRLSTAQSYMVLIGIATLVLIGANKLGVLSGHASHRVPTRMNPDKVKLRG
ncbi:MraY family glycosyltransferase [Zhaonella formicivorans]|uniref:MraY family glycosyltransferase n=1 Tax=Zhaonella formicivorans TaxID=2528593 RepID=UPI001D10E41F|nr:MraY family glycosyltransferase [Zhaonella formicivorans]